MKVMGNLLVCALATLISGCETRMAYCKEKPVPVNPQGASTQMRISKFTIDGKDVGDGDVPDLSEHVKLVSVRSFVAFGDSLRPFLIRGGSTLDAMPIDLDVRSRRSGLENFLFLLWDVPAAFSLGILPIVSEHVTTYTIAVESPVAKHTREFTVLNRELKSQLSPLGAIPVPGWADVRGTAGDIDAYHLEQVKVALEGLLIEASGDGAQYAANKSAYDAKVRRKRLEEAVAKILGICKGFKSDVQRAHAEARGGADEKERKLARLFTDLVPVKDDAVMRQNAAVFVGVYRLARSSALQRAILRIMDDETLDALESSPYVDAERGRRRSAQAEEQAKGYLAKGDWESAVKVCKQTAFPGVEEYLAQAEKLRMQEVCARLEKMLSTGDWKSAKELAKGEKDEKIAALSAKAEKLRVEERRKYVRKLQSDGKWQEVIAVGQSEGWGDVVAEARSKLATGYLAKGDWAAALRICGQASFPGVEECRARAEKLRTQDICARMEKLLSAQDWNGVIELSKGETAPQIVALGDRALACAEEARSKRLETLRRQADDLLAKKDWKGVERLCETEQDHEFTAVYRAKAREQRERELERLKKESDEPSF